jgi:hypothetical protein
VLFAEIDAFFKSILLLKVGLEKVDAVSLCKHPAYSVHDL